MWNVFGPRTGVWENVRDIAALGGEDMSKLQREAWGTTPCTRHVPLQTVSLERLCCNK